MDTNEKELKNEELVGLKGGEATIEIETIADVEKPTGALDKGVEMLWGLGTILIVIGILGLNHSLVFGVFETTLLQNIMYIFAGFSSLAVLSTHKKMARIFGYAFFVLGFAGFFYPIGNFADSYLHFFLSFGFLYVFYSNHSEKRETIHLKPA